MSDRDVIDAADLPGLMRFYVRPGPGAHRTLAEVEAGAADELLTKRINVAFYERMRFFAKRIAETELHQTFAQRQAAELLDDEDVEWSHESKSVGGAQRAAAARVAADYRRWPATRWPAM